MKKQLQLCVAALGLFSITSIAQTRIEQFIGDSATDEFGETVSISDDGSVLAVGTPEYGLSAGYVSIYKNDSGNWTQLGNNIQRGSFDELGDAISISNDGTIVAIGSPEDNSNTGNVSVYNYNTSTQDWEQMGSTIFGENTNDFFGRRVSLSGDGTHLVISSVDYDDDDSGLFNVGMVKIYEYNNTNEDWEQKGATIFGTSQSRFGSSLSFSDDGSILAVGAYSYNSFRGQVTVFNYLLGAWTQIGNAIVGGDQDGLGNSVSLSADGSIVAAGGSISNLSAGDIGITKVYELSSGNWSQLGGIIFGEAAGDESGFSVSLSNDGQVLAIGSLFNDGDSTDEDYDSGHTRIYIYNDVNTTWEQKGNDIDGIAQEDRSGYSVSLSGDGKTLAVGSPFGNTINGVSGYVSIYDLSAVVLSTDSFNVDYFTTYPNPAQDNININLKSGHQLKQVNIYSVLGKYLFSEKTLQINTTNLSSGMYILEVETNLGKSAKKVVIE